MSKAALDTYNTPRRARRWFRSGFALGTAALIAIGAAPSYAQTTIYLDDFSGSGDPLNGAAVDIGGETWTAGPAFLDDGSVNTVVADGPNGNAAWLPFTPEGGMIYTLSAEIENDYPDWIALGFMPASPPGGDWTATDYSVRHSNNGAHAWLLLRTHPTANDIEAFNGPSTSNPAFGGDIIPATDPVLVEIVLDTADDTWTAEYILNGTSQGVYDLPASATTGIGGVGLSRDRYPEPGTGGFVDNFQLTEEAAPPPGTWDGDVNALWSVAANWVDDVLPNFFGFNDSITFAAPNGPDTTLNNDVTGVQLVGISFRSDAPAFNLLGNAIELSAGVTNLSTNGQTVAFDVTGAGTLSIDADGGPLTLSGVISGTDGLVKGGAASLTLSNGLNDFSGPVTFTGVGNIVLTASGALGDPNSTVSLSSTAFGGPLSAVEFAGGVSQGKTFDLNARVVGDPPHIVASAGVNTLTGQINGYSGGNRYLVRADAGSELDIEADFAMLAESASERRFRFDGDGVISVFGQLENAPEGTALGVLKANGAAGVLNLVGVKNYSGITAVDSGTIALVDPGSTNSVPHSLLLQCATTNGVLDFSGLSGGGMVLAPGQTLAGDGAVVGAVVASAGSVIAPGVDGIGVLELPDLTLEANANLNFEIGTGGNDRIDIASGGALSGPASGAVYLNVDHYGDLAAGDYIIIDWSGASSVDIQVSDFASDAGTLSIVDGTQLQLTIVMTALAEVLISDTGNNRVLKHNITQFGVWVPHPDQPVFAEGVVGEFDLLVPIGLAKDSSGYVYLAEGDPDLQDRVMKLTSTGDYVGLVAEVDSGDPGLDFSGTPNGLAVHPDGTYLFVSIAQPNSTASDPDLEDVICRIDLVGDNPPETYIPTTDIDTNYVLQDPQGLAFGPDGYLYVANNLDPAGSPDPGSRVLRFDVSGATGVFAGVLTTEHRETKGLYYDPILRRLLVSLNQLNDIWAYSALTLDYVAPGDPSFTYVYDMGVAEDYPNVIFAAGDVYFTDITNDVIRRVTAVDSAPVALGLSAGLVDPQGLLILSEIDPFDFDNDGDVDLNDATVFVTAIAGPDVTVPPVGVSTSVFERADIDNDGDVDTRDYWAFMRRFGN